MRAHLATLTTPTTSTNPLPTKLLALADLEQLLESIDNVNALSGLGLWPALVALLGGAEEAEMRRGAAACVGTAVQNNAGAQGCVSFLRFLSFCFPFLCFLLVSLLSFTPSFVHWGRASCDFESSVVSLLLLLSVPVSSAPGTVEKRRGGQVGKVRSERIGIGLS